MDGTFRRKKMQIKPIKIIKEDCGTFWNANDGTETYSRDIVKLLNILCVPYELKDNTKMENEQWKK